MPSCSSSATKSATVVEALYTGDVCSAAKALSSKATRENLVCCVNNLTSQEVGAIAHALHSKVKCGLSVLVGDESVAAQEAPQSPANAATSIKAAALVLKALLDSSKADVHPAVIAVVFELHDKLLAISEPLVVQDAIAKLLIDYWHLGAPRAMEVVVQLGPFLLWRAIEGKPADVKRLHAVREAFSNLDLRQPESQDTVDMILAACITPAFLRCAEGRRTLAFFLALDADVAQRLLRTMTGQICVGKPSIMDAFGEILFKAWQLRTEQSAEHIEWCIQQLMQDAIMAQSTQMSINMRRVLSYLHEQRRFQGVGALLHRLYEPILWCHLKAAHFQVRLNALGILLEAFPIQDSTGNVEMEEGINMQLTHVMKTLRDPNAQVRAAAAWGACELLTTWWELLPGQAISRIMVLLQDTAFDGDAPKVRMALLEGLAVLVENPLAQHSMALLLPNLRPVLFDANMNVRVRMASLMMRVSQIQELKWWTVIPVPELLHVMGNDCDPVAKIIQAMLFSQFIETRASGNLEECARLLQLLRDNSSAGTVFCKFLARQSVNGLIDGISSQLLLEWSRALARHLIKCKIGKPQHAQHTGDDHESGGKNGQENVVPDLLPQKGRSRVKRSRSNVGSDTVASLEVESPEEWTGLVAGLRELVMPLHQHLQQANSSRHALPGKAKKKSAKNAAKTKQPVANQSSSEILSPNMLTSLVEKAPTLQAAQIVLSIGCGMPFSTAAHEVCEWCLDSFKGGYLYLPGINNPGQRSARILLHNGPRQGRLSGSHLKNCAVVCQAVDLALLCKPQQLLSLIGDALTDTEGQQLPEVKRRRGRGKHVHKDSGASSLNASGAIALAAIATRDAASQRLVATCQYHAQYLAHLSEVMAKWVSQLTQPALITNCAAGFLHDVLLVARSFYMVSAIACQVRVDNGEKACSAIKSHADRVRGAVMGHVEGFIQQAVTMSDVVRICSDLIRDQSVLREDVSEIPKQAPKRVKAASMDASISYPQAALLRILCDGTHDLAVAANAAVDVLDELPTGVDVCAADADAVHAAAAQCKIVWQSLVQVLSLHVQIVSLGSGLEIEMQSLLQVGKDVALCGKLSVQAIFRGMGIFHVEGDVSSLFAVLGKTLALLHATCGKQREGIATSNTTDHLADLASASLTGCIYIETDEDVEEETALLPVHTPMRSHEEAEEVMGMLIKPSVLLTGDHLRQIDDASSQDLNPHTFPVLWISDAIKNMDPHVCSLLSRVFMLWAKMITRWKYAGCHSCHFNHCKAAAEVGGAQ